MSLRRRQGPDPGQQRRQAHANELLLAVAARLLGEARRDGAFPTGDGALKEFRARLAPEIRDDEHIILGEEEWVDLPRTDYKLMVGDPESDAVHLSCHYGSHSLSQRLRIDGVLDEGGFGFGISPDDPEQRVELTPEEQEVMRLASAGIKEGREAGRGHFGGEEFQRAVAVGPQPGAPVQILAVELYSDGIAVRYAFDDPVRAEPMLPLHLYELAGIEPPLEELLAEARAEGGNLAPDVSVHDDLGTEYMGGEGRRGGVQVAFGEACFAPAVPAAARRLTVSTYAGTVEVDLSV
ncbi:MAG TPA: hypothetical protein VGH14_04980 [Solirubrobacterales bacterium]